MLNLEKDNHVLPNGCKALFARSYNGFEAAVWAAAGDETSAADNVAATGTAYMIRAANTPPRTRIPKFMRHAPLSFRYQPHTPWDRQIPNLLPCL